MKSTRKFDAAGKIGGSARVYGGDTGLIHARDGGRASMGEQLATNLGVMMREQALADGRVTDKEAEELSLCPGCYMTVVTNCLLYLAEHNGQDLQELADTMPDALQEAASNGGVRPEHVLVKEQVDWRHLFASADMMLSPWF